MNQELGLILKRGVAETIVEDELIRLLNSGKLLRLKQGFDPSHPDIHLGHVVGLKKLRQLQDLGHKVILIVGDWTAQIGDPSGQSATRPMLTPEEVLTNAETYMKQFFRVVDREKTDVRWQSEWYDKFTLAKIINLTSKFTVAQFLAREDFSKRHASGRPIAITELLYPLLQAYDSVVIKADVEFGGTDQKFNCLVGRELQQMIGQPPQQILLVPLLIGTDGKQKMSKSLGNCIAIVEAPNEMYGKVMSLPDELIMDYFELATDVPDEELKEFRHQLTTNSVNPIILKKRLGREIVAQFHNKTIAQQSEEYFIKVVQKKEIPEEMLEVKVSKVLLDQIAAYSLGGEDPIAEVNRVGPTEYEPQWHLVHIPLLLVKAGLVRSRSEAKRLISQGAIDVDYNTVTKPGWPIMFGSVIKVGKHRFVKIVNTDKR